MSDKTVRMRNISISPLYLLGAIKSKSNFVFVYEKVETKTDTKTYKGFSKERIWYGR